MALRGDLGDFSLADVFRLVTLSGRSGVLRLQHEGLHGSVWFRGGDVFFATSDHRGELLGERLVAAGRITPAQLARALDELAEEPEGGRRLGEAMIDMGIISEPVLEQFVQEQIQDTIFDLFLWEGGEFEFELLQAPPEGQDIGLSVSVENIIMESARRLTEATALRKQNLAAGIVYRMAEMPDEADADITLRPDEWRVIRLTDGTRTVSEIAAAAGLPLGEVARTLHGLRGAGLLEIAEPEEEAEEPPADRERAAELAMVTEVASMPAEPFEPQAFEAQAPESPLGQASRECPPPAAANTPAPVPTPETPAPASAPAPAHAREEAQAVAEPQPEAEPEPQSAEPDAVEYHGSRNLSERYKIDDVARPGESIWASVGDELTALTGSVPTRKARATEASAAAEAGKSIRRDPNVSRETLEAVVEGLEQL